MDSGVGTSVGTWVGSSVGTGLGVSVGNAVGDEVGRNVADTTEGAHGAFRERMTSVSLWVQYTRSDMGKSSGIVWMISKDGLKGVDDSHRSLGVTSTCRL